MSKNPPRLKISKTLSLPLSFTNTTHAILGKKRGGKSYKAKVVCEELLRLAQQCVVLDPTGAWWGLRSSADGKSVGFPITIFGGKHGDLPLVPDGGAALADAIVGDRFSAIIDTTELTKGEEQRFAAAFLERLYRKNTEAMHLFLDEADVFAPQKPFGEEARTLGACQSIVRRGGIKGIGVTMITQRPQVLNKDVLSQCDMLTCLKMNHPKDINAIDEWVGVHGDPALAKQMMASLPALPKGEAWVWAPGENIFELVEFRELTTFDNSKSPTPGEKTRAPKVLATIDIERIGRSMAEAVQQAKESDPKHLRAELAKLKAQLASPMTAAVDASVEETEALRGEVSRLEDELVAARAVADRMVMKLDEARAAMDHADEAIVAALNLRATPRDRAFAEQANGAKKPAPAARWKPDTKVPQRPRPQPTAAPAPSSDESDADGAASVLAALVQYPAGLTTKQLSAICGLKRSARNAHISTLVAEGKAERTGEKVVATSKGRASSTAKPLPVGAALRDYWRGRLNEPQLAIFDEVLKAYPEGVPRNAIGEAAGVKRSARNAHISKLVAHEIVTVSRDGVKAADVLFGVN